MAHEHAQREQPTSLQRDPQQQERHQRRQDHRQQDQERQRALRLSWDLRAPPHAEETYWKSAEVQSTLRLHDVVGLTFVVANMSAPLLRSPSWLADLPRVPLAVALVLALLQLAFVLVHPATYSRYDQGRRLAVVNRLLRAILVITPMRSFGGRTMQFLLASQHHRPLPALLLGYAALSSIAQLQVSFNFALPTKIGVFVQPLSLLYSAAWHYEAAAAMDAVPGMRELAMRVCDAVRGAFELLLYTAIDLGAMPGVRAAGLDGFGVPDSCCCRERVFGQLIIFSNLMFSLWLPLLLSFAIELHHKVSFWEARGVRVSVARSPLLPLPEHPLLSHALVALVAPVALWFASEHLVAFWPAPPPFAAE